MFNPIFRATLLGLGASLLVRGQAVEREPPQCDGVLYDVVVDFERDRRGNHLAPGETPDFLPGGIRVKGFRRGQPRQQSDLVLYDSGFLNRTKIGGQSSQVQFDIRDPKMLPVFRGLYSQHDDNVLIINDGANKTNPTPSPTGGFIFFGLRDPVHQLNAIRVLGLEVKKYVVVEGLTSQDDILTARAKFSRTNGDMIELDHWFDVRRFKIKFSHSAGLASVNMTLCGQCK